MKLPKHKRTLFPYLIDTSILNRNKFHVECKHTNNYNCESPPL